MAECGGEDLVLGRVIGELKAERQAGNPLSYLDEVRIRDGQVFMRDNRLGLSWAAPAAEISLRRDVAGLAGGISLRSEERRGGKACVGTCNTRWSPSH